MKTNKAVLLASAVALAQWMCVSAAGADELYRTVVNLTSVSTNSSGGLAYHRVGNRDFIAACASEHSLTNLSGLALMFNRTANKLQVVSGTNQTLLCTPLSFSGGVTVGNTNKTRFERLENVFVDAHTVADGTLAATERYRYGTNNQITAFSLRGQLQYALAAAGTNAPVIYTGSILAGSGQFFEDEDDQGGDHDKGGPPPGRGRGRGHDHD